MLTLKPGHIASLGRTGGFIFDFIKKEYLKVRREDLALVRSLALGIDKDAPEREIYQDAVLSTGWASESDSNHDPLLETRIQSIDRRYQWSLTQTHRELLPLVLMAHASRRYFDSGLGQHAAFPETVVRRACLAGEEPKRILVIGDDDFLSVALQACGHSVTVLDIDPGLLQIARRVTGERTPPIVHIEQDIRLPMEQSLFGYFDAFFVDPMSSEVFFHAALSRGLSALKPGGKGFVCVSEAGLDAFRRCQKHFGFQIDEHWSDFNHYYLPSLSPSPYCSDLMEINLPPSVDLAILRELAAMPIDARGMLLESRFGAKPAAHYIAKKISIERSHLIHLKTAVGVLKHSGVLKVLYETFDHHDEIRSYVALTTEREVVFIRIHAHQRTAELFMAPSNPPLETVLITALAGLLDIDTTVHRKHRMRNVHIIEYPHTTHKPQS